MKKDFVIYTKMLETTVWLFDKVNTFPKKQRFVLGQQIENRNNLTTPPKHCFPG